MTHLVERLVELRRHLDHLEGLRPKVEGASDVVDELARLPGFRNVVLHDYVALDFERVVEALEDLDPIERFLDWARRLESSD